MPPNPKPQALLAATFKDAKRYAKANKLGLNWRHIGSLPQALVCQKKEEVIAVNNWQELPNVDEIRRIIDQRGATIYYEADALALADEQRARAKAREIADKEIQRADAQRRRYYRQRALVAEEKQRIRVEYARLAIELAEIGGERDPTQPYGSNFKTTLQRVQYLLVGAKRNAMRRKLPYDLNAHVMEIVERFDAGVCELTGLPFKGRVGGLSAGLNRKDRKGGYTYDNLRVIISGLNGALSLVDDDDFTKIAAAWGAKFGKTGADGE